MALIRKYRSEDEQEKIDLHLKSIREIASKDYTSDQIDAWTNFDEENSIDEEVIERWVAEEEGEIVGFADYRIDEGRITGVYVHPDYLRQGIGSQLLDRIVEDARRRGIEELECESSVTAKDFYISQGFKVVSETVHSTSGEDLKAFKMKKEL